MGIDEGTVPERLAEQAGYCRVMGSPLYAALLDRAAEDAARDGVVAEVVEPVTGPYGSMLGLRLMGAVHRLVLEGAAPALAQHYPSAGGDRDAGAAWPALTDLLRARTEEVRDLSSRPADERGRAGRCPSRRIPRGCPSLRASTKGARGRGKRRSSAQLGSLPVRGARRDLGARTLAGPPV